jgi:hypothetical protein
MKRRPAIRMIYPHLGAFVAILVVGGVVVSAYDYVLARHLATFSVVVLRIYKG